MPKAFLTRRVTFSASHRLHSHALSEKENITIFGKCNHKHGHGHNYILKVTIKGEIDNSTGIIMNLVDLKAIIQKEILDKVDHKHLNFDVPEFKDLNPTAENMTVVFWRWLQTSLPEGLLYEVYLEETENNIASYRGE